MTPTAPTKSYLQLRPVGSAVGRKLPDKAGVTVLRAGLVLLVTAVLPPGAGVARAPEFGSQLLNSINEERRHFELPPMVPSAALTSLASKLAGEISADQRLDYELVPSSELLSRARAFGYRGILVQEIASVDDGSPCEVVELLRSSLGRSDVYRRPEAMDIGVGRGFVGESPVTVIVVGVPVSTDPIRKRWPGTAPREYLLADLFRMVEEARFRSGLPPLERSADLDGEAQQLAGEILDEPSRGREGSFTTHGGIALFCKDRNNLVRSASGPIAEWLQQHRDVVLRNVRADVGLGLASRGRDDRLEAVWLLLLRPAR